MINPASPCDDTPRLDCMPKSLEGVLVFADVGLFVIECILFRRSTCVYTFGIFVFFVCQGVNQWPKNLKALPMCENPLKRLGEVVAVLPFIIPVVMSVSVTKLNEMRIFLMNDTMAK